MTYYILHMTYSELLFQHVEDALRTLPRGVGHVTFPVSVCVCVCLCVSVSVYVCEMKGIWNMGYGLWLMG